MLKLQILYTIYYFSLGSSIIYFSGYFNSIGLQLIYSIVDFQLQGKIEFKINKGLECNIMFPIKEEL